MLLDAILKAIKEIESIEKRTRDMDRILQNLKEIVNIKMKESLMDFISIGEKIGYTEIKKKLNDLLEFIDSIDEKSNK